MLQEVHHPLVERVVLALHVRVVDGFPENVLVERSREVAVQQLVVIDCLGDDSPDESEVVEVVGVHVGTRVGHVSDAIARRSGEEGIVWVEHISCDDDVELAQEPASILPLFSLKLDVEVALEVFRRSTVELAERVLEDVLSTQMHDNVLSPQSVVHQLQLVSEVATFDVEIEDLGVVDQYCEGSLVQRDRALTQDLVQYSSVLFCRAQCEWITTEKKRDMNCIVTIIDSILL